MAIISTLGDKSKPDAVELKLKQLLAQGILQDYYLNISSDSQEERNRQDLQNILHLDWSNLSIAERGLIAFLCNTILA